MKRKKYIQKVYTIVNILPVNDPHGNDDGRNLNHLSDEEVNVQVSVEIGRVERQAVIYHCVQRPATRSQIGYEYSAISYTKNYKVKSYNVSPNARIVYGNYIQSLVNYNWWIRMAVLADAMSTAWGRLGRSQQIWSPHKP